MIAHESKNQETTYSRHLLYAAIPNAKKFDLQRRAADRGEITVVGMHLLLLPRGQDGLLLGSLFRCPLSGEKEPFP